jgi:hypothetical protein
MNKPDRRRAMFPQNLERFQLRFGRDDLVVFVFLCHTMLLVAQRYDTRRNFKIFFFRLSSIFIDLKDKRLAQAPTA